MKKLIIGLATVVVGAIGLKFLISSSGISFDALMSRRVSKDEYKGFFQINPISLSSGKTMQASDFEQLSDIQSPLVGIDAYGNSITDLALKGVYLDPSETKSAAKVGYRSISNDTQNESWTYAIDPNAKWVDVDGNLVNDPELVDNDGQITGKDFANILLYVLNPNVNSDTVSFFENFIEGFTEAKQYVNAVSKNESSDSNWKKLRDAFEEKTKDNDSFDGELILDGQKFNLGIQYGKITDDFMANGVQLRNDIDPKVKGANYVQFVNPPKTTTPFFETIMSYVVFSPMPKKAILDDYVANYATPEGFNKTLYSGPYTLTNYSPNNNLTFKKNNNYVNAEDIKIKRISKFFKANVTPSDLRVSFEAGDLTENTLSVTDGGGWKKYVGNDYKNPNFGAVFSQEPTQTSSFGLFYNPINTAEKDSTLKKEKAELLTSSLVRSYMTTRFNRDYTAKFYSSKFDKPGADSSAGINFWTASKFISDGKDDYSKYMKDEVASEATKDGSSSKPEQLRNELEEGNNFFQKDDAKKYLQTRAVKTVGQNSSPNNYIEMIKNEVKKVAPSATSKDPFELKLLLNVSQKYTLNMNAINSIRMFNKIAKKEGVPIFIRVNESKDQSDFMNKRANGGYDLIITGWSPDYSDPLTFATFGVSGDMNTYYGISRIINNIGGNLDKLKKLYDTKWTDSDFDFSANNIDKNNNLLSYDDIKNRLSPETLKNYGSGTQVWKDNVTQFVNQNLKYTKLISLASKLSEQQKRYKAFAFAESYAIYSSCIVLPVDNQFLPALVKISYVKPFEYSTAKFGTTQYQHRNWEIMDRLPTREQLQKWLEEFNKNKQNK